MNDLYKLKDMLVKELNEFGKSGNLSKGSLETIDKLAHATKNLAKVIECCESDSGMSYGGSPMYSGRRSYADGRSYADERMRGNKGIKEEVFDLMDRVPDEHTRNELYRLIERL